MSRSKLLRCPRKAAGGLQLRVESGSPAWRFIDFQAHQLPAGGHVEAETAGNETALVVLGGRCTVRAGSTTFASIGDRQDVWDRTPPYVVMLPARTRYRVEAEASLHLVTAGAAAKRKGSPRLIRPQDVVAEERGEGQTYRYIQHVLPPSVEAARLILVEVYTPAGNWSSFPPHKHDTEDPPRESYLEELYYFQVKPATGFALQRVYTPDRTLDESIAVGNGDLVLIPRGYHTVSATPGHDCYYLNVMAGPTRAWNFTVDPDYVHLMNWQKPAVAGGEEG